MLSSVSLLYLYFLVYLVKSQNNKSGSDRYPLHRNSFRTAERTNAYAMALARSGLYYVSPNVLIMSMIRVEQNNEPNPSIITTIINEKETIL